MSAVVRIPAPMTDVTVALECEANRATREGFPRVAERQNKLAKTIAHAYEAMSNVRPDGYRVEMHIVFTHELIV